MFKSLGIRFDIQKCDSGFACWKIFWAEIKSEEIGGAILYEGDTEATLDRNENVYCLRIDHFDQGKLDMAREKLEQSSAFKKVAASPMFIEGMSAYKEPLVEACKIKSYGAIIDDKGWAGPAYKEIYGEKKPGGD